MAEAFDYPIAKSALPQDAVNRRVIEPLYSRHRPLWVRPLVIDLGSKLRVGPIILKPPRAVNYVRAPFVRRDTCVPARSRHRCVPVTAFALPSRGVEPCLNWTGCSLR